MLRAAVRAITKDQIAAHFKVDPELGSIWYLTRAGNWLPAGFIKSGGRDRGGGYRIVSIPVEYRKYVKIRAHHVMWMLVHGEWASSEIDHVNGDRDDNRIANLRLATISQNRCNRAIQRNNKSGFKWVYKDTQREGYWRAEVSITVNGVFKRWREYNHTDPAIAHEAAKRAAQKLHGDFFSSERT